MSSPLKSTRSRSRNSGLNDQSYQIRQSPSTMIALFDSDSFSSRREPKPFKKTKSAQRITTIAEVSSDAPRATSRRITSKMTIIKAESCPVDKDIRRRNRSQKSIIRATNLKDYRIAVNEKHRNRNATAVPRVLAATTSMPPTTIDSVDNSRFLQQIAVKDNQAERDVLLWNEKATKLFLDMKFEKEQAREERRKKLIEDHAGKSVDSANSEIKRLQQLEQFPKDPKGRGRRGKHKPKEYVFPSGVTPEVPQKNKSSRQKSRSRITALGSSSLSDPSPHIRGSAAMNIPGGFDSDSVLMQLPGNDGGPLNWGNDWTETRPGLTMTNSSIPNPSHPSSGTLAVDVQALKKKRKRKRKTDFQDRNTIAPTTTNAQWRKNTNGPSSTINSSSDRPASLSIPILNPILNRTKSKRQTNAESRRCNSKKVDRTDSDESMVTIRISRAAHNRLPQEILAQL